jgi:hypothetical protein
MAGRRERSTLEAAPHDALTAARSTARDDTLPLFGFIRQTLRPA